jgi:hypothetical protein
VDECKPLPDTTSFPHRDVLLNGAAYRTLESTMDRANLDVWPRRVSLLPLELYRTDRWTGQEQYRTGRN